MPGVRGKKPFLIRLGLGIAATLAVWITAVIGLGWGIQCHRSKLDHVLSPYVSQRLFDGYLNALAGLLPRDSDGDGVCDGIELWEGTNPNNRHDFQTFSVLLEDRHDGFSWSAPWRWKIGSPATGLDGESIYYLSPGERRRIRGWVEIAGRRRSVPSALHLFVSGGDAALVALPGGKASPQIVQIPVVPDGSFEFDIEVAKEIPEGGKDEFVQILHPADFDQFAGLRIHYIQPALPALTPQVAEISPASIPTSWFDLIDLIDAHVFHLKWAPPSVPCDGYFVEAKTAGPDAKWFTVASPGRDTECAILQSSTTHDGTPIRRPLQFRIVPFVDYKPSWLPLDVGAP